jgi:hypothetical protein
MITLAELKYYLGITGSDKDALLQGFITAAMSEMSGICYRNFIRDQYTETIPCCLALDRIYLKTAPIVSVQSLKYYDGTTYSDLILSDIDTLEDSIEIFPNYILLRKGYTSFGYDLKVEYTGGYKFIQGTGKLKVLSSVDAEIILGGDTTNITEGDYITFEGERLQVASVTDSTHFVFVSPSSKDYTSVNYNISNVPEDLRQYCKELSTKLFYESPAGKDILLKTNESLSGTTSSTGIINYRFLNF